MTINSEEDGKNNVIKQGERKLKAENLNYVAVNDLLQVKAVEDPDSSNYRSRVNDIEEGRIIIAWPTENGIRLPVKIGQELKFTFLHNEIPYEFVGFTEKTIREPLPQVTIRPIGFVTETQRRREFRLKCLVPVQVTGTLNRPDSGNEANFRIFVKTETFDLSAGGISIHYERNIPEGTPLEIQLALPDDGPEMKIPCRIVYSDETAETPGLYRMGMKFLAISQGEQARIFRFLQRQQLQRLGA